MKKIIFCFLLASAGVAVAAGGKTLIIEKLVGEAVVDRILGKLHVDEDGWIDPQSLVSETRWVVRGETSRQLFGVAAGKVGEKFGQGETVHAQQDKERQWWRAMKRNMRVQLSQPHVLNTIAKTAAPAVAKRSKLYRGGLKQETYRVLIRRNLKRLMLPVFTAKVKQERALYAQRRALERAQKYGEEWRKVTREERELRAKLWKRLNLPESAHYDASRWLDFRLRRSYDAKSQKAGRALERGYVKAMRTLLKALR